MTMRVKRYRNSAALLYFYAPHNHFAFLVSNFSFKRGFQTQSRDGTSRGLTLNLEPFSDKESPETFYIFRFHAFHEKEVKSL